MGLQWFPTECKAWLVHTYSCLSVCALSMRWLYMFEVVLVSLRIGRSFSVFIHMG